MRVGERKRKKNTIIASLSIGGLILLGFTVFILYMNKNADYGHKVILGDSSFEVTGLHGGIYEYNSISSVELKDTLPMVLDRSNGAAIGEVKKGTFKLEDIGLSMLYLLSEEGPFLYVKVNDFNVIINFEDSAETEALYDDLNMKLDL